MRVKLLAAAALCVLVAGCLAVMLAGCSSSGANGVTSGIAPLAGLPWPPPAAERETSNTDNNFNGSDWVMKSPTAGNAGNSLELSGGGELPWAIYAVTGLGTTNELLEAGSTFSESPLEDGDGTNLFIALANYNVDSWEWFEPEASPWTQATATPADYRSPGGFGYLAVALAGPGTASVDTVSFTTSGDFVAAPQNLTAEAVMVELIELNWDSVPNAQGYNIYRGTKPDMSNKDWINEGSGLVTDNFYEDEFIFRNLYYYYQVTAVGAVESAPSNTAKVWSHGVELPAPQNFRVVERTAEMIRVGWDWEGPNPSKGFRVFVDTVPDFHIDSQTENHSISPFLRSYPRQFCEPEVIYYFKVCAESSANNKGRMSEEIFASVTNYWDWSDMQTIAVGELPLRGVKVGDELAVAYFNGPSVDVSVSDSGTWSADTALPENGGSHIYADYLDFAYADGTYLVTAWESRAGDSYAAYGSPGSWTRDLVHGDGNTGLFHPESGFFCICAVNAEEMSIVQLFNRAPPDAPQLLIHTKSLAGGGWSQSILRQLEANTYTPSHCLQYYSGDLYYLGTHGLEAELYFTSRDGGWIFEDSTDIVQSTTLRLRKYHDLTRFNSKWYTTAYDAVQQNLYMLDEASPVPWNREAITSTSESSGYYARMDAEGEEAIVLFYGGGSYHFGLYSKGWADEMIIVPGVEDFGNSAEIFLRSGEPYFIFRDDSTGEIKIARGVPPEE